ncbi:MAG: efflux RND transporter periplasmic adaptor subunit [Candidatus Sumerlaeia bacterium]|nr:efflux RND transporter periplasmic adaptor subunit [Candidatus Sumerlaeia bacterium]
MNRRAPAAAAALAAALSLAACEEHPPPVPGPARALEPVRGAAVAAAARTPLPIEEEFVGTVAARFRPVVSAKVSGAVQAVHADVGDAVAKGQLLVELDAQELGARLRRAIPERDLAATELERMRGLVAQQAAAQTQLDAAEARHRSAVAGVEELETMLSYARIESPIDGIVRERLVDVGDLASPGRGLLRLEDLSTLRFETAIPESLSGGARVGDTATVAIASLGESLEATLSELTPSADPLTRTFMMKYDLPATEGLRPGQFGRLTLHVGEASPLVVPQGAVLRRGQLETVWAVEDGRARMRLVTTGKVRGGMVEILSGLSEGERVIAAPPSSIRDGQPVAEAAS